jgi:hypothetical protein
MQHISSSLKDSNVFYSAIETSVFSKEHRRYNKYICMQYNSAVLTLEFAGLVMDKDLGVSGCGLFYDPAPTFSGETNKKHKSQAEFPM